MDKIKIFIADDHSLVRSGIRSLLLQHSEIEVIGEAENGEEAVINVNKLKPDIVLLDISMPQKSGIEATAELKQKLPEIKIIILTMHENEEYIFNVLKNGADGVLHKNTNKDELITAIKNVFKGNKYFGNSISQIMISNFMKKYSGEKKEDKLNNVPLTRREKEILKLVGKGMSNSEIGSKLSISPRTVDTHKTNLMQKLNLKNVAALIRFAYEYDSD